MSIDTSTQEILRRGAKRGQVAAYVRAAIIEKAARDEMRDELAELRARLDQIERKLGIKP